MAATESLGRLGDDKIVLKSRKVRDFVSTDFDFVDRCTVSSRTDKIIIIHYKCLSVKLNANWWSKPDTNSPIVIFARSTGSA